MTSILETALSYIDQGFSIVPCHGKKPATTSKGQFPWSACQVKRPTFAHVHSWDKKGWLRNVAVVCGQVSGNLVIIDLDGNKAVETFESEFPQLCKDTRIVLSGSGQGKHIYFYCDDLPHTTRTKGYELRANGCYVVAPPSIHPDSKQKYKIICNEPIRKVDNLDNVVQWITAKIPTKRKMTNKTQIKMPTSGYGKSALSSEIDRLRTSPKGNRNNQLNLSAFRLGQLVADGVLNRSQVESFLLGASMAIGLSEKESADTIESGISAGIRKPRGQKSWLQQ